MVDIENDSRSESRAVEQEIRELEEKLRNPPQPKRWNVGFTLAIGFSLFTLIVAVLEVFGVVHEFGEVATVMGTGASVAAVLWGASERSTNRIEVRLGLLQWETRLRMLGMESVLRQILQELRKK